MGSSILVVDDELLISENVCTALERAGYDATYVLSGQECIKVLEQSPVDGIVLDLELGDAQVGGDDIGRLVNHRYDIPIVFYTAHTDRPALDRLSEVVSYGLVTKGPGDEELLLWAMDAAMKRRAREKRDAHHDQLCREMINALPFPVWTVATDDTVVLQNASAAALFRSAQGDTFDAVVLPLAETGRELDSTGWRTVAPLSTPFNSGRWLVSGHPLAPGTEVRVAHDVSELERASVQIREISHRVKNQFAVLDSLLAFAERESRPQDLRRVRDQIGAARRLHDRLYEAEAASVIVLCDYLTEVLSHTFPVSLRDQIDVGVTRERIEASGRTAMPLGLIVVELATNAVKHAFPGAEKKWFRLAFAREHDSDTVITISHAGSAPIAQDFADAARTRGLGLVRGLVKQLHGTISIRSNGHAEYTIRIPIER